MVNELEYELGKLAEDGYLKEKYCNEKQDLVYSLTDKGEKKAMKMLMKNYEYRIVFFQIALNRFYQKYIEKGQKLNDNAAKKIFSTSVLETMKFFKKDFNHNFLEDLFRFLEEEKDIGITISEEDKESLLELYHKM